MVQGLFEVLAAKSQWSVVILLLRLAIVTSVAKIIIAHFALSNVESKDKAAILRALANLFRWWGRGR